MNNKAAAYVQAIRGPIVLISLGGLFALHQDGAVSFWRTWPLLIIVIGVMKLVERLVASPTANVPPNVPPGGGYPPPFSR